MTAATYKGYTLVEARADLELWKEAKRAAATGKSYTLKSKSLTRYDLAEINAEIDRLAAIVDVLSSGAAGGLVRVRARMRRGG